MPVSKAKAELTCKLTGLKNSLIKNKWEFNYIARCRDMNDIIESIGQYKLQREEDLALRKLADRIGTLALNSYSNQYSALFDNTIEYMEGIIDGLKGKTAAVSFKTDGFYIERVRDYCDRNGFNLSKFIRLAISEKMERDEKAYKSHTF